MKTNPDVIVVGSGHAGVEAAYAAARLKLRVLVVTMDFEKTAFMSCNPSIGGVAKGHIVKEIDVLGGIMPRGADLSCIQYKRLNASKGPAVRGTRMQCDKDQYSFCVRTYLSKVPGVSYLSEEVESLIIEKNKCLGVVTCSGRNIKSRAVILTTGTFMRALLHFGSLKKQGGRMGEQGTCGLSLQLKSLGVKPYRLKTGTPPRLKKKSIDFEQLVPQSGDKHFKPFSFFSSLEQNLLQKLCHLTYTNERTHNIIRENLHLSPLYRGEIKGAGPRYCPSIEDKIIRFSDKDRHQSFLEPETLDGESIYLQGLSTSLPVDVQYKFLRTIKGLENVNILRPGYAVEYDFFDPQQLWPTLETKALNNLFFAGQINGSSGYEEAAGMGIVAGINAASSLKGWEPLVLKRSESYIGVLIDDLTTKGTKEPYRMLTSRAEYRLHLREDNVLERLFKISKKYRLLTDEKEKMLEKELEQRETLLDQSEKTYLSCKRKSAIDTSSVPKSILDLPQDVFKTKKLKQLLSRPDFSVFVVGQIMDDQQRRDFFNIYSPSAWEAVETRIKYTGYIRRQEQLIRKNREMEEIRIDEINFNKVQGLSLEALEKLNQLKPKTLGQASRISGINPSALQAVLIHIKSKEGAFRRSRDH